MGEMTDYYLDSEDPYEVYHSGGWEPYYPVTLPTKIGIKCPECGEGIVVIRHNSKTKREFAGCSRFPTCKFSSRIRR